MRFVPSLLLTAALLASSGSLGASPLPPPEDHAPLLPRAAEPSPSEPEAAAAAPPVRGSGMALVNPGVEDLDTQGRPVGWTTFGQPEVREEDGNIYIRASSGNTYRQMVALPFHHRPLSVTG